MSLNRDLYDDCLGCDGLVFLNDSSSYRSVVEERNVEGCDVMVVVARIHPHCRAAYEAENGPVVCESDSESDNADECERRALRELEDGPTPLPQSVDDPESSEITKALGVVESVRERADEKRRGL